MELYLVADTLSNNTYSPKSKTGRIYILPQTKNDKTISSDTFSYISKPIKNAIYKQKNIETEQNGNKTDSTEDKTINQKYTELEELWQVAQDEQGIIGDAVNGIKNLFHSKYGSNSINEEMQVLSDKIVNNTATQKDIDAMKNKIDTYRNKQDKTIDKATTTAAGVTGSIAGGKLGAMIGNCFPPYGVLVGLAAGAIIGGIAGACTKVGLEQLENGTDDIENNEWQKEDVIKDVQAGSKAGAIAGGGAAAMEVAFPNCKTTEEKLAKKVYKKMLVNILRTGELQKDAAIYTVSSLTGGLLSPKINRTSFFG